MKKMPVLFIGHGSPMNALENNAWTAEWIRTAAKIPKPEAIVAVSAHWYTDGTRVSDTAEPQMIYDMYGFPDEIYQVLYDAPGSPSLARETAGLIGRTVTTDSERGLDHGAWSVLCRMYPDADIPVFQLSVDKNADAREHFRMGGEIAALREKGVLILGSGNIVHNLSMVSWETEGGFGWAGEFDSYIRDRITGGDFAGVLDYKQAGKAARLAVPTPDHFWPLLYVLGAAGPEDRLTVFNNSCTLGSVSMTSFLFG